jgi:hypothetical protein
MHEPGFMMDMNAGTDSQLEGQRIDSKLPFAILASFLAVDCLVPLRAKG